MRTRLAALMVLVAWLSLGSATPARAQGVFYELGLARGAFAVWENPRTQSFAFAFIGQGIYNSADLSGPLVGDFGCAGFENGKRGVFGCGELDAFSMNDDLGAASGKGSFDATIQDFKSGKSTPGGKISIAATWKATGDPAPYLDGGFHAEPAFVGVFVEPNVVRRYAGDGVKGRVTKSSLGPGPTKVVDAATFAGGTLSFELHGDRQQALHGCG